MVSARASATLIDFVPIGVHFLTLYSPDRTNMLSSSLLLLLLSISNDKINNYIILYSLCNLADWISKPVGVIMFFLHSTLFFVQLA